MSTYVLFLELALLLAEPLGLLQLLSRRGDVELLQICGENRKLERGSQTTCCRQDCSWGVIVDLHQEGPLPDKFNKNKTKGKVTDPSWNLIVGQSTALPFTWTSLK